MSTPSIFSFNGRIQRVDYLLTTAVVIDLLLVINRSSDAAEIPSLLMLPVAILSAIVLGWLGLAAAVKRCHDLGQSGFYGCHFISLCHLTHAWQASEILHRRYRHSNAAAVGLPKRCKSAVAADGAWNG